MISQFDTVPHDFSSYCEHEPDDNSNARHATFKSHHKPITTQNDVLNSTVEIVELKILPNPANDKVTVYCPTQSSAIEIYDVSGRTCLIYKTNAANRVELSLYNLTNGMYNVLVKDINGAIIGKQKLVINKK